MKKCAHKDYVHLSIQAIKIRRLVKHISSNELGLQSIFVLEELVSELEEFRPQVAAVEVLGRNTVIDQLAYLLSKTASQIEEGFVTRLQPLQNCGVDGIGPDGELKEAVSTKAWVGPDLPRIIALSRKAVSPSNRWFELSSLQVRTKPRNTDIPLCEYGSPPPKEEPCYTSPGVLSPPE